VKLRRKLEIAASEFVELYNAGGAAVDIGGWKLQYDEPTPTDGPILLQFHQRL